jgi:hypothetical protein
MRNAGVEPEAGAEVWSCDRCGQGLTMARRRWHLDPEGLEGVADRPGGYDFCSTDCLSHWASASPS